MKLNILKLTAIIVLLVNNLVFTQNLKFSRTEDVVYARKDGMALTMDVFQPENPNGIGAILLVSGGWNSNHDKINTEWLEKIQKLISYNQTVFAVVHSSMPKYKIPDAQKDLEYAVKFVKLNAHRWNVNPEKLGIVGHSSGGHLALLHAATAKKGNENSKESFDKVNAKIQAVACFYPPTDFLSFGANGINALASPRFQKFLPAFTDNIKDTITIAKIAEEVSPIKYVTSDMPPTLIISGTGDKLVPFMQSQLLIDKLNQLGVPCKLEVREGKDHGWPDIADDYSFVAEWFEKFLK